MINNHFKIMLLITILANTLQASSQVTLTQIEKDFIKNHPTITLGTGDSWAPYVMKNKKGEIVGYDNDILTKINKATGANFVQVLGNWSKMQRMAKKHQIDGLSTLAIFQERKKWFNFSNIYISLQKMVMVKPRNPLNIKSNKDLFNKTIVIHKGNMMDEKTAKQFINSTIIYANTVEEMLNEVIHGKADLTFGNSATTYLLGKLGLPYLDFAYPLKHSLDLAFAIRKDWPEAISILNKGLSTITEFEKTKLKEKWFRTYSTNDNKLILTKIEQNYLKEKKQINMCIDPDWMPYEKYQDGKYIGMIPQYFKIFQKGIGIPINLIKTTTWKQSLRFAKNRKCDILSLVAKTKKRKKFMNFTTPYFTTPVVIATKPDVPFIVNLKKLSTKKIGIVKGYAFNETLRKNYPNINIINVKDISDGLKKVANGQLFGFIDTLATIGYMFQKEFTGELKISGKFDENLELSIAVRNDDKILLSILNKAVKNLSEKTKQHILSKYIGIKYEKGFDYSLFWQIFALLTALVILLLFRNNAIHNYNRKIKKYIKIIENNVLVSTTDIDGNITSISEALCQLTGYTKKELIGKNHNIFRHEDMEDSYYKEMWETILKGACWQGEMKNRKKDGSYYWTYTKITPIFNKDRTIKEFNAIRQNITDKKKLEKISVTDTLTQIPNRLHLDNNYDIALQRAQRYKNIFSIILIDIDLFKDVNDDYGHQIGDNILIQLSELLQHNIRNLDILGRWGGEEFLIICPETDIKQAELVAKKIKNKIECFDFPIVKSITCSFGISQYHENDEKEDTFKRADEALYHAKNSGRNKVVVR